MLPENKTKEKQKHIPISVGHTRGCGKKSSKHSKVTTEGHGWQDVTHHLKGKREMQSKHFLLTHSTASKCGVTHTPSGGHRKTSKFGSSIPHLRMCGKNVSQDDRREVANRAMCLASRFAVVPLSPFHSGTLSACEVFKRTNEALNSTVTH